MVNPVKIVGANGKRHMNDFYPTPPECTHALLWFLEQKKLIHRRSLIWEPACGSGSMVNVIKARGYDCLSSDIDKGTDFLSNTATAEYERSCDWIITNPPFSIAKEFIIRAKQTQKPFAFLLKSQYWHSSKRLELFRRYQPTYILPLTWRPDFTGQRGSLLDMIWVVWVGVSQTTFYEPLEKPKGETDGKRTDH